jgi:two-component system, chemotaxis family, protein-glutamate methylesterase/glutaminase
VSAGKIKVLVVDDSALVRRLLNEVISREPDMEVVGLAADPFIARDKLLALHPDVITLDIEMPRMDGLTFLTKLMHHRPLPVIIISSVAQSNCDIAVEAMRRGAVEVLTKPSGPYSVGELSESLPQKIRAAFAARVRVADGPPKEAPVSPVEIGGSEFAPGTLIAIGASTGGTQAIETVLLQMPERCPPILITQHIPALFSASFASRLNSLCKIEVQEARDGDLVAPGRALVAPGNFHMMLRKSDGICRVAVKDGPRVHYQRPAVDVLFQSVAAASLTRTVGVLLTGMGSDGAQGLLRMREAGARTIAQDEGSCVVFGMPKVAIEMGAAEKVLPLSHICGGILAAAKRMN